MTTNILWNDIPKNILWKFSTVQIVILIVWTTSFWIDLAEHCQKKSLKAEGEKFYGGGEDFLELEARRSNMSDKNPATVCTYMSSSEVTQK